MTRKIDEIDEAVKILEKKVEAIPIEYVPIGTIVPYGGKEAPEDGWLLCDGRSLSRDKYPDLYHVILTFFGGSDSYFNLPDLQGRFVRGVDNGQGRDPDSMNRQASNPKGSTGDEVGSLQEDAFQGHFHATTAVNADWEDSNTVTGNHWKHILRHKASVTSAVTDPGYDTARVSKESRPKNVYVNWIIKAKHMA